MRHLPALSLLLSRLLPSGLLLALLAGCGQPGVPSAGDAGQLLDDDPSDLACPNSISVADERIEPCPEDVGRWD